MDTGVTEYSILGHNIRLNNTDDKDKVSPDEVVTYVQSEIDKMKLMSAGLEESQIAVSVSYTHLTLPTIE